MNKTESSLTKRRLALNTGLVALVACGLPARARANANDRENLSGVTLNVGTYKGWTPYFFGNAGVADFPYTVRYAEFTAATSIVEALLSGHVDYAEMSEIPPIFTLPAKTPLRQIAVLRGDVNNQVILVPKNSSLEPDRSLRGKRIGYERATTSHYFLLKLLRKLNVAWSDIQPIALTLQDGLLAFQTGKLDAWVAFGLGVQVAQSWGARILLTAQGFLSGNYVSIAHADSLADSRRRVAVLDYLHRERLTYEWINRNPDKWAARSAQISGVPSRLFLDQFRDRTEPFHFSSMTNDAVQSQQQVADVFADAGLLRRRVDVNDLWDRTFASTTI
jgi:sulfonate transport system substrate-binding protein